MRLSLRPYQAMAVESLRDAFRRGYMSPLLVLPTGGGKTQCFAYITEGSSKKGKRVLIVAHRRELIKQASRKLTEAGVEHGIIAPGFTPTRHPVQVASIQTIVRRLDRIGQFDLIVIDEGHHAPAGGYVSLIASQPSAKLLLVTATPERLDGRGLGLSSGGCCDTIVVGPSTADLIDDGYLTPIRIFAPPDRPDLSDVKTRMGEYETTGLAKVMSAPTLVGEATAHYAKHAPGKPAIVFCVSVEHARNVAASFRAAGWRSVSADGSMSQQERDSALSGLENGSVQVLTVCDLVSEGLDITGIAVVIFLRATKSLVNFLQWTGRGLRPVYTPGFDLDTREGRLAAIAASDKPYCLILDHAGCTFTHGMPTDEREWSLIGREKKPPPPAIKQCPECFTIHKPVHVCPTCGHDYAAANGNAPGRELRQVEGDLMELSADMLRLQKTPLNQLLTGNESRVELHAIARARGYKAGWVHHVMATRRGGQAA